MRFHDDRVHRRFAVYASPGACVRCFHGQYHIQVNLSSILPYLTELEWQAGYGVNIIWTPVGTPVHLPTRDCVPAYIVSDGRDHCLCRTKYKTGNPMLQCSQEKCGHWYHLQCVGVAADEADSVDFVCHICTAPSPAQAAQQQQGSTPRESRRGLRELDSNVTADGPWGLVLWLPIPLRRRMSSGGVTSISFSSTAQPAMASPKRSEAHPAFS